MWILKLLRRTVVWAASLLGGLVTVFVASELMAPFTTRRIVPQWRYYETTGGDPGLVIVCLHGLWSPDYFDAQLFHLRSLGNVLVMKTGGQVLDNAPAVMVALKKLGLLGCRLGIYGFSRGTLDLLRLLDLCEVEGWNVSCALVNSGTGRKQAVKWPSKLVPLSARILRGGPLMDLIWQAYWKLQGEEGQGPRGVKVCSVTTGILDLCAIPEPSRSYRGMRVVLVRHEGNDPRVDVCDDAWLERFPEAELILIPGHGHGEYLLYPDEFNRASSRCFGPEAIAA